MTNTEAIETLRANYPDACFEQLREAVDAAIVALKAQNASGDTISRQAAIDALEEPRKVPDSWTDEYAVGERAQYEKDVKALNSLSSAERREAQSSGCEYWDSESNFCTLNRPSAERRGRWIYNANFAEPPFKCSACGKSQGRLSTYCPDCGAEMEVE